MKVAIALVKLGLGCHAAVASCVWLIYREPAAAFDRFASMAAASHLGEVHRAITSTLRLFVSLSLIQPSRRNDGCSTCGLSPHSLIVCLRHWNSAGISEIIDVDPIGFPGS